MTLQRQIKNRLMPLLLVFAAQKVCAQLLPADDFFNGGAQLYISNNIPAAKQQVETGLKLYPNDEKLKKLEELLKQQQQSQNSQSQQNQQQQQSQSQQDSNSQQNSQGQKKDEQQKQSEQQKSSAEKKDGQKADNQNAEGQPVRPGEMTPEEAKRLLDAQKGNEQTLTLKPKDKPENSNRPIKDW
jgi:Ca-activated chloride channel family protein